MIEVVIEVKIEAMMGVMKVASHLPQTGSTDPAVPPWRRLRRRAYWAVLVALVFVAERWPLAWGRWLCARLAAIALRVRTRERAQALTNLERAFPDWSGQEREDLLRHSAAVLGANLFDALAARRVLQGGTVAPQSEGETFNEVVARLARPGRGLIFLTGHLGCWELLGAWAARQLNDAGLGPLAVVTGTLHNPAVDRLVQERRRRLGMKVLPRHEGARPLLRHLQAGGAVAILLDQNTGSGKLSVPFLGGNAPTPTGPAQIALRYGVPVLPVAVARVPGGHQVRWLEPWVPPAASNEHGERAQREFLTWANASLEELIRRNPAEWVWFHRRWDE